MCNEIMLSASSVRPQPEASQDGPHCGEVAYFLTDHAAPTRIRCNNLFPEQGPKTFWQQIVQLLQLTTLNPKPQALNPTPCSPHRPPVAEPTHETVMCTIV